jgi:hypothetical protein
MARIFNTVRQRLLAQNRFTRYLVYAIGEIVLVVVGILIAFQVNTWNAERKERALEVKTLNELRAAFSTDLVDITFNLAFNERGKHASEQLLKAFDLGLSYHDSLDRHFGNFYNVTVFINSTGAYETLKARGVDIITNDTLRGSVVRMHDVIYNDLLVNERNFDYVDLQENKRFMLANMTEWKLFDSAKPMDYERLRQDPEFRNRLEYTVQCRTMTCTRIERAKAECERVILALEKEINGLIE